MKKTKIIIGGDIVAVQKNMCVCVFIIPKERYVVLRKAGGPSNISVMASSKDHRPSKNVILSFQVK